MYQSVYAYITNKPLLGNTYLLETIFTSGMIALAILTVDSMFRIYYKKHFKEIIKKFNLLKNRKCGFVIYNSVIPCFFSNFTSFL